MSPKMGQFFPFLFFGLNYLEYICSSHFKGLWAISLTIRAKNWAEVVENRLKMVSAITIFATFLGPFGPQHGPKLAHLVPPLWSIVVLEKKVIRNVEISCFTKKEPKIGLKTFIRDFLRYFFSGLDFCGFWIFSYNF